MNNDIKELHRLELCIAQDFIKICDTHRLKYYMLGGSMLGAIRHKGFIPWDDDMDFGMPRKDYEKFIKIAPNLLNKRLKLINYKTDPEYHYYITRIQDTQTKVIETRFEHEGKYTHASIDIFPLDGSPNNPLLRKIFFTRIMMHRAMMSLHYKDSIDPERKRGLVEKLVLALLKTLPTDKMFDAYKEKEIIDKLLKQQDMTKAKISGNIMGAYRTREMIPTDWYGEDSFYEFEGIKLRGLKEYDKYLSHLYGDYMKMPPEGDRKTHFKIIQVNNQEKE